MQNNRAIWLAILVVAIASAVMIFFVLPQIKSDKYVAGEVAKTAVQPAEPQPKTAEKATGSPSDVLQKMNRLKADASAASEALRALYANGKVPSDAELADAKAKLEAALTAIAEFKAPAGSDATVGGVITGMSASAAKALSALNSMPADAGQAADAAARIAALFSDKTARSPASTASAPAAALAPADNSAPADAAADVPTFDVLRVEKDGSTVIAGAAAPKAKVEIMDGDKPIGSAVSGGSGDFAVALDNPLPPGDHSLVLRATGPDGKVVNSQEVATVSVPPTKDGKLLAMVTKPGEASRILTKPEASTEMADAGQKAAAKTSKPSAEAAPAEGLTQQEAKNDVKQAPAAAASGNGNLPPLPDGSKALTTTPPIVGPASTAPQQTAANAAPNAAAPAAGEAAQKAPEAAAIRIDAVEIEGDKIFVAGTTRPLTTIQVYADDKLIETTKSSDSGHFEAENAMPLSVGTHIIRADMMDPSGSKVVVRASVPFNRPAGDQVSVVADTKPAAADAATPAAAVGIGQLEQAREEAAKALVLLKGLFANGKVPAKDQLAAALSANQIALKALATFKPAADAGPEVTALAQKVAQSAASALKLLQDAGDDPQKVGAAIPRIEAAAKDAMPNVAKPAPAPPAPEAAPMAAAPTTAPASPDQTKEAQAPAEKPAQDASAEAAAPTSIEQAPLKESKDSVIIRKGDTLWQISRRVYGRGVRYTTIYLANQDQIDNPNMITPGQVFGVPDKVMQSDEDAEKANREYRRQHGN